MLGQWLVFQERKSSNYQFGVVDITEVCAANGAIMDHLALQLVLSHGVPQMIRQEYEILCEDASELGLDILKRYIEEEILPQKSQLPTRIGNFGEVLAASYLLEFEGYWLPIYKLRYREKKAWAMRLTDLCVIRVDGLARPLVCYGEVKTKSAGCNKQLAVEGHNSLAKDDALTNPEILRFMCVWFYEAGKLEEATFISRLRLGKVQYDKKHALFLVHDKDSWTEEILENLHAQVLDERLVDFSVRPVLIHGLREIIDSAYERAWVAAVEIVDGQG